MKRRSFTIVEMLVAIGLLTALLAGSAVIFSVSVQAQRTAKATSEIARRLRAITDQLNADFAGLQKDAPLAIWFEAEFVRTGLPAPDDWAIKGRHDHILFFAEGDFQTTGQYGNNNSTIAGNMARIYYGQANEIDYSTRNIRKFHRELDVDGDGLIDQGAKLLAKRQHVLTSDADIPFFPDVADEVPFANSFSPTYNDFFEYDTIPLARWEGLFNNSTYRDQFLSTCFDSGIDPDSGQLTDESGRPGIDFNEGQTMHLLMSEEVGSFAVDLGYTNVAGQLQWMPENLWGYINQRLNEYPFVFGKGQGFNLNLPPDYRWNELEGWWQGENFWSWFLGWPQNQEYFPKALKFTFTLYDSLGIYEDGKRFTHIVYLDD